MITPTPPAAEQLLDPQLVIRLTASKYYMLASVVILYFDYFLTFDLEVKNLWKKPFTGPTILFFLNRYYPLLLYAVVLVAVHDPFWAGETCESFKRFPLVAALVSEAIIGIIVILRLFALYSRSIKLLCILLPLYILQLMLGGWASDAVTQATGLPPGSGCIITVSPNLASRFAWLWGSAAIFDSLVFGLTMYRTARLRETGLKVPLTTLFLRDGLVYFGVMFSAKLLNFTLFWTAVTSDLVTLNWTFNNIITVIMINRLVLNLREEGSRNTIVSSVGEEKYPPYPPPFMETFVAKLGGSIPSQTSSEGMYHEMDEDEKVSLGFKQDSLVKLEEGRR